MVSCFPEGKPLLPECDKLLIQGECPPSFPIHLCLSYLGLAKDLRALTVLIYCGSSNRYTSALQEFNDEYFSERSGDGSVSPLLDRIRMMYPPTIGHLRGILEMLRPQFSDSPGTSTFTFDPPPCALVLVDPSNYFVNSETEGTFSHYSSVIVQALASARFMDPDGGSSGTAIGFAVFDRGLGRMRLPILSFPVHDNASPSSSPQRQGRREIAEEDETELVYKYFDVIGIIEALGQGSIDAALVSEIPDRKQFVMRFRTTSRESSRPVSVFWSEEAGQANVWAGKPSTRIKPHCS